MERNRKIAQAVSIWDWNARKENLRARKRKREINTRADIVVNWTSAKKLYFKKRINPSPN